MYIPTITWPLLAVGTLGIYIVCRLVDRAGTPEQALEMTRRKTRGPYGVAGWLLILVAILVLWDPVLSFFRTEHDFSLTEQQYGAIANDPQWHTLKLASWLTYVMESALAIYAGLELMFRRQWVAVKRAIVILWLTGPLGFILDEIALPFFVYGTVETSASEFLGYLLTPILVVVAWTMYLLNSKRVRATYRKPMNAVIATADA